jgi:hypothetical protein
VVAVIVALVGTALYSYLGSTARTLQGVQQQRPLSAARLTADRATVTALRTSLQLYYAQHGAYPATKDAVAALLTPAPSFQCEGNDFRYDPVTGTVSLLVDDPASC